MTDTPEPVQIPDTAQLELTRGETCVLIRYVNAGGEAIGRDPSTLLTMMHIRSKHEADLATLTQKLAKLGAWFIEAEQAAEDAQTAAASQDMASEGPTFTASPDPDLDQERDVL